MVFGAVLDGAKQCFNEVKLQQIFYSQLLCGRSLSSKEERYKVTSHNIRLIPLIAKSEPDLYGCCCEKVGGTATAPYSSCSAESSVQSKR